MSYFNNIYSDPDLPHRARTVYMYLRDRSNGEGECWPGIKRIKDDLHLSERTVKRAVRDLVDAGYLVSLPRFRENGGQTSNLYRLH